MLSRFFPSRPAKAAGEALYSAAAARARLPALYLDHGVADTREGRFELYCLHVILLLDRLKGQGEQAAETSQILIDRFVRGLDDAFRELGVGDLSVAKRVKALAEAFHGRLRACEAAFAALPDRAALEAVLARTVLEGAADRAGGLADHVLATRQALADQPLDSLLSGQACWEARS